MANPVDVLEAEVLKKLNDMADRIFQLSQENLIADGKIDTANLLKSGNINRLPDGAEIVYTAPYADSVEFGRLPGSMPPVDSLVRWAQRKLKSKNPRSAAWAIAKSIKERGIEASPFLKPAAEKGLMEAGFNVVEVRL